MALSFHSAGVTDADIATDIRSKTLMRTLLGMLVCLVWKVHKVKLSRKSTSKP